MVLIHLCVCVSATMVMTIDDGVVGYDTFFTTIMLILHSPRDAVKRTAALATDFHLADVRHCERLRACIVIARMSRARRCSWLTMYG